MENAVTSLDKKKYQHNNVALYLFQAMDMGETNIDESIEETNIDDEESETGSEYTDDSEAEEEAMEQQVRRNKKNRRVFLLPFFERKM